MKTASLLIPLVLLIFAGCTSDDGKDSTGGLYQKRPVVTIETSGDLYNEGDPENFQIDFFGNCSPEQSLVFDEVGKAKKGVLCSARGRYRHSMNISNDFFEKKRQYRPRSASPYSMKVVSIYHPKERRLRATSYILIDKRKKEVKAVINKQVRFERIPTGGYEPITQYNALGNCAVGTTLNLHITAPDRSGQQISKYTEQKKCQVSSDSSIGSFYFSNQAHGYPKKGTLVFIKENRVRGPSSLENLNWSVPINPPGSPR